MLAVGHAGVGVGVGVYAGGDRVSYPYPHGRELYQQSSAHIPGIPKLPVNLTREADPQDQKTVIDPKLALHCTW